MLDKLQQTQTNQRKAYSSLEKMVSVGYNYYSQCYDLKQKKMAELTPDPRIEEARARNEMQMQLFKLQNGHDPTQIKGLTTGKKKAKRETSASQKTEPESGGV